MLRWSVSSLPMHIVRLDPVLRCLFDILTTRWATEDPWRDATLSAERIDVPSTEDQPIFMSNGFHCSDLRVRNAIDPTVAKVQEEALKYFDKWLATYEQPSPPKPTPPGHEHGHGPKPGHSHDAPKPGHGGPPKGGPKGGPKKTNAWFKSFGDA